MAVSRLQPPTAPAVQTVSKDAGEKNAEFLAFKLLNKRARVKLSPESLAIESLPGKVNLFAAANIKGWFAAVTRNSTQGECLIFSPLLDLNNAYNSTASDEIPFTPQRTLPLRAGPATTLAFANNDTRLLVGLASGGILIHDTATLFTSGDQDVTPLQSVPPGISPLKAIVPNPGDHPEMVAVLREFTGAADATLVDVLDTQKMETVASWSCGATPETIPTALTWSPKGKALALGLASGGIVAFNPQAPTTPKSFTPKPATLGEQSVISVAWLSNSTFYVIYAQQGPLTPDVEQTHYIISVDGKAASATDTKLTPPYMTFPGLRNPGSFVVTLRNWAPSDFIVIVGDSTSSDIGVVGGFKEGTEEAWYNISLDESATPALPLDKDGNDTIMTALELGLTANKPYVHNDATGQEKQLSPPPVLYAYSTDGTLQAWHIINSQGESYPGMSPNTTSGSTGVQAPAMEAPPSASMLSVASAISRIPSDSAMNESPLTPITTGGPSFSQPVSGNAFGQSTFGQTSAFGQPALGQTSSPSVFANSSTQASGGFGAFSNASSKFGSTNFGFGAPSPQATPAVPEEDMAASEPSANMAAEPASSGFGGLSLGGESSSSSNTPNATNSMFGSFSAPNTATSSGSAQPSTISSGFGAFGSKPSAFGVFSKPAEGAGAAAAPALAATSPSTPSSAFGQSAFGSTGFGQSSFGVPASSSPFGKSTFGAPSFTSSNTPSNGGFGAFANNTPATLSTTPTKSPSHTAFGAFGSSSFKPNEGSGAFANPTTPSASDNKEAPKTPTANAFGSTGFGSSGFGKPSVLGQSTFGGTTSAFGKPTTSATTSAFSTPSGSSGGFASFANSDSSFGSTSATGATLFGATTTSASEKEEQAATSSSQIVDRPGTPPKTSPVNEPVTPSTPAGTSKSSETRAEISTTPTATPTRLKTPENKSPFTSSSTGPSSGAFSSLKSTSTNAFGSSAFGSVSDASKSPFFAAAAKGADVKPVVSAFGASATPPKVTTPSFGSTTGLGGKPTFGATAFPQGSKIPIPSTSFSSAPKSGGFGAFSDGASTFSSTAGSKPSFGDLLKSEGDTKIGKEDGLKSVSVFGSGNTIPTGTPTKPSSVFGGPNILSTPKNPSVFTPTTPAGTPPKSAGKAPASPPPSDGELSPEAHPDDQDEEEEGDTESFVSEEFSDEEDGEASLPEDEDDEGEEEDGEGEEEEETEKRAPAVSTKSRSATPSTSTPSGSGKDTKTQAAAAPPIVEASSPSEKPPTRSTTPPGTPSPTTTVGSSTLSTAAPIPVSSAAASKTLPSAPVNFGNIKGATTRPVKSSPLANVVTTGDESDLSPPPKPAASAPPTATVPPPLQPKFPLGAKPADPPSFGTPILRPASAPVGTPPPSTSLFSNASASAKPLNLPSFPSSSGSAPFNMPPPQKTTPSLFNLPPNTPFGSQAADASAKDSGNKPFDLSGFKLPPPQPSALGTGFSLPPTSNMPQTVSTLPRAGPTASPGTFGTPLPVVPPPAGLALGQHAPPPVGLSMPGGFPIGKPFSPLVGTGPPKVQPVPVITPPPPGSGMDAECSHLLEVLNQDLEMLKNLASVAKAKKEALKRSGSDSKRSIMDLADSNKWTLGDLVQFTETTRSIETNFASVREQQAVLWRAIRRLESDMLKASTRKEEIARFSKAQSDPKFAKMLKVRTLSPEHMESQTRLRREIRLIRDRIQKLEGSLQEVKKRARLAQTGQPGFRGPSIDKIHRTLSNIDIAIEQQEDVLSDLSRRMVKLNLGTSTSSRKHAAKGQRRFSPVSERSSTPPPRAITPVVAATAATALNAERAALKLKQVLLATRKEPLLNTSAMTSASSASKQPLALPSTPAKSEAMSSWSSDAFNFDTTSPGTPPSTGGGSRSRGGSAKHLKAVQLKKSPGPAAPTVTGAAGGSPAPPPSGFSWGPLPTMNAPAQKSSLAFDLRSAAVKK